MEPNRVWHEPVVIVYGNLITPGTRCSASAYDLANRRWYQLNVNSEVDDEDEWMSSTIEKHISTYHRDHGTLPPYNVINTARDESFTTFESKPDVNVARRIRKKLYYDPSPERALTTTSSDQLFEKLYLGRGVDRCSWRGKDCVFKRIEFDVDIESMDREIKTREDLRAHMHSMNIEDYDVGLEQHFNIIPILAVVLKQDTVNDVVGILMPYGGPSLESIFESIPTSTSPAAGLVDIVITVEQLRDLTGGVSALSRAGVVHGDINDRNTLLRPSVQTTGREKHQEMHRLVMVDLGSVAPDYTTDANALGQLFLWCKERTSWDSLEQKKIDLVARTLQENGDFDKALEIMDSYLVDDF